jgi:hypothetical protein
MEDPSQEEMNQFFAVEPLTTFCVVSLASQVWCSNCFKFEKQISFMSYIDFEYFEIVVCRIMLKLIQNLAKSLEVH